MKITIALDDEEKKILVKRAKKNFLSLREQVEDIVRRSCASYHKKKGYKKVKVEDKLLHIFSRERKGRKKKK